MVGGNHTTTLSSPVEVLRVEENNVHAKFTSKVSTTAPEKISRK